MKRLLLLLPLFIGSFFAHAQKNVVIRNLWADPEVHVAYQGYEVSFTIKDINKAMKLLAGTGDKTFDTASHLDPSRNYYIELYPGYRTEYHDPLQPILQLGVGAYLLYRGHAVIKNHKHKKLKNITMDMMPFRAGEHVTTVKFYDPANGQLIFNGQFADGMINADLGID